VTTLQLKGGCMRAVAKAAQIACPASRVSNPCTGPAPPGTDASVFSALAG